MVKEGFATKNDVIHKQQSLEMMLPEVEESSQRKSMFNHKNSQKEWASPIIHNLAHKKNANKKITSFERDIKERKLASQQ
jgi:hypothetical protein